MKLISLFQKELKDKLLIKALFQAFFIKWTVAYGPAWATAAHLI